MNESIVTAIESVNKLFLEGPFGAGKTTLAIRRATWLLQQERVRGSDILVLTPQRTLGQPYKRALRQPDVPPGPTVQVTTVAGMARQSVQLYWPLVAEDAGFARPGEEPVFLNLETSQYHMAPLVDSALASGEFDGVRVERNRVISQVLDNLNKAALNGFTVDEAYDRLENAVPPGEHRSANLNALVSARDLSHIFRSRCLSLNLLDFGLQIEVFNRHVLPNKWSRTHLFRSCRHLIFDNLEEDTYTAHQLVREWLPSLDSALLVADRDGGVRAFLGAAPRGAENLRKLCDIDLQLDDSQVMSAPVHRLERDAMNLLRASGDSAESDSSLPSTGGASVHQVRGTSPLYLPEISFKFYPQMIAWVAETVQGVVASGTASPSEIVILAPYMSDALKFSLQSELDQRGVPSTTHRPSRALRTEPAARCLLALAALAHPHWGMLPSRSDFAAALSVGIAGLDPVRASLLASIVYRPRSGLPEMGPFDSLVPDMQERVTFRIGEQYDKLRGWIYAYRAEPEIAPLDHFWSRIFGEALSQPGYAFHEDMDAARVSYQLVASARNFRWALEPSVAVSGDTHDVGKEFLHLVHSGAVAALFAGSWEEREGAVLIAPAYTYLMRNRPVDFQFWLDIGSSGWWERLYQPLTHPYVLSRDWRANQAWTDFDEYWARQQSLRRLVLGLVRRARKGVYLGLSQYSESGYEQQGALKVFVNRLLAASGPLADEGPGKLGGFPSPSLDASEEGFISV